MLGCILVWELMEPTLISGTHMEPKLPTMQALQQGLQPLTPLQEVASHPLPVLLDPEDTPTWGASTPATMASTRPTVQATTLALISRVLETPTIVTRGPLLIIFPSSIPSTPWLP